MITVQEQPIRLVNLKWQLASQKGSHDSCNNTSGSIGSINICNPKGEKRPSNFPLSSELVLLDSKKSIRSGVKNSLLWFHAQNSYIEKHLELEVIKDNDNDEDGNENDGHEEIDFHPVVSRNEALLSSMKQNPSRVPAIGNNNKLLGLVQRRVQRIVEERFSLPVSNSFKICIVNTVLQDYETDDLSAIYNKLFRKEGKERIMQIIEQSYFDKYPLEQLDNFYDELFGCLGLASEFNIFATNKPSFYKYYTDIWKLDRDGFKDYDYQCFINYCEEQQQQQYDYDDESFSQEWLHEYVNQGVLMNVEKFYYYFNRKVEPFRDSEERVMKMNESRRNSKSGELSRRSSSTSSGNNNTGSSISKNNVNQVAIMKLSLINILNSKMSKIEENGTAAIDEDEEDDDFDEEDGSGPGKHAARIRKLVRFDEVCSSLDFDPTEPSCIVLYDNTEKD